MVAEHAKAIANSEEMNRQGTEALLRKQFDERFSLLIEQQKFRQESRVNEHREQLALHDSHTQQINAQRDANHQEILALVHQQLRPSDEVEALNKDLLREKQESQEKLEKATEELKAKHASDLAQLKAAHVTALKELLASAPSCVDVSQYNKMAGMDAESTDFAAPDPKKEKKKRSSGSSTPSKRGSTKKPKSNSPTGSPVPGKKKPRAKKGSDAPPPAPTYTPPAPTTTTESLPTLPPPPQDAEPVVFTPLPPPPAEDTESEEDSSEYSDSEESDE